MKRYIDTHGHLNSEEFLDDMDLFVKGALDAGVEKIVIPGTSFNDSKQAIEIASNYDNVFAMVALHPNHGFKLQDAEWLNSIDGNELVGVGETGIDLFRKTNPPLDVQTEIFRMHLRFALKYDIPAIIHSRDAEAQTYAVLQEEEFKDIRFVIHCCTMNKEWTLKFVGLGGYISFSGILTFKKANDIREAAMAVPLDRILTETDAPYLAPFPKRGKINKPEYVAYTSEYLAEIRSENNKDVLDALWNNAHRIFRLPE